MVPFPFSVFALNTFFFLKVSVKKNIETHLKTFIKIWYLDQRMSSHSFWARVLTSYLIYSVWKPSVWWSKYKEVSESESECNFISCSQTMTILYGIIYLYVPFPLSSRKSNWWLRKLMRKNELIPPKQKNLDLQHTFAFYYFINWVSKILALRKYSLI